LENPNFQAYLFFMETPIAPRYRDFQQTGEIAETRVGDTPIHALNLRKTEISRKNMPVFQVFIC
jgi:hypothetical protein